MQPGRDQHLDEGDAVGDADRRLLVLQTVARADLDDADVFAHPASGNRRFDFGEMGRAGQIAAIAAAHHRFNYVHPFPDGNGRVSRLMSHAMASVAGIGALALVVSLLFTAVYHVGYPDFRGSKVKRPLTGDVMWSVPTLVTLSPLGTPIAHIATHVTAVVHSYDTDLFLPPHKQAK